MKLPNRERREAGALVARARALLLESEGSGSLDTGEAVEVLRALASLCRCPHSACSQHYIDTGRFDCIEEVTT